MFITEPLRFAEPYAINDRGMVQLVGYYGVLLVEQWFKNPTVRVESGNIKNCVFRSEKSGQLGLKLLVNVLGAADETYAAHAISPLVHVFSGRFHNFGM